MPREHISLQLTNSDQDKPEGVAVAQLDNMWTSPPGGWLAAQKGVWIQLPDGMQLLDEPRKVQIALCRACIFSVSKEGEGGTSLYPATGGSGGWKVTSTFP